MRDLGRIHNLGMVNPAFPVIETVGGIAGTGLVIGGVVVKGTPGTIMGILGGITLAGSLVAIVVKMTSGAAAPGVPTPTAAPPPPPPPPPKPSTSSYSKYAEYAQAFAPAINQLFSAIGLKGFARQPAMLVAVGRGR